MSMESLTSCHAELASHAASRLRRNAKCSTVIVRNHHSLDRTSLKFIFVNPQVKAASMGAFYGEKILLRSVRRYLQAFIRSDTHLVFL